mmetsp:Transcript_88053/g.273677  ORF Transcript_88053/g.273677 Transcript_88053/m.273677 type:complete len:303 (+) Transcript_88053:40-948(+)
MQIRLRQFLFLHTLLQLAPTQSSADVHEQHGRVLVIFAFFDSIFARPNLRFLLRHVVGAPASKHVDVLIVDTTPHGPTVPIPFHPQVRYLHRKNEGFDMCSYKVGLNKTREGDYAYIILMNGSVRGPFAKGDWVAPFRALFTKRVAMVGTTAACHVTPHIQSMFLMMNPVGVRILNGTLHCDCKEKEKATTGPGGEFDLSRTILKHGYGLNVRQAIWRNHNFSDPILTSQRCKANYTLYDPYYSMNDVDPVTMQHRDVDPEDAIFFKTNRGISPGQLSSVTKRYDDMCTSGGCGSWSATIPF